MKMKIKREQILILLANKIFLYQKFLIPPVSTHTFVTKKMYTFFYITKILSNFGLLTSLNKTLGY
jgi:hypothetical protein